MAICRAILVGLGMAGTLAVAAPSSAHIQTVDFTVTGGAWSIGSERFGLPEQPTLTGQFKVDDTKTGNAAFIGLTYKTGTHAWHLSDLFVGPWSTMAHLPEQHYDGSGKLDNFVLEFGRPSSETYVVTGSTAGINFNLESDGNPPGDGIACNGCVSITSVTITNSIPEPATWALMTIGLGGLGAALRSQRRRLSPT